MGLGIRRRSVGSAMSFQIKADEMSFTVKDPSRNLPEHRLIASILATGIKSAATGNRDALRWLESDDIGPFTAQYICNHLKLNKLEVIRRMVREEPELLKHLTISVL